MSVSLESALVELSKQIGDYWASTSTSGGSSTTIVDTALSAKAADWITDEAYDRITSGTYDDEERKISSLSSSTLTTLAHGGTIATSVTYEIHRLFTATEKRRGLIYAARRIFPYCFKWVRDETLTLGNWLRDGDLEYNWTSTTAHTYWKASTSTMTQTTTLPYYRRSSTSMKIDTAAGYVYQSEAENKDLMDVSERTVTFTASGWCNTASCLRLAIYDGTTTTYSSYHAGDSEWEDYIDSNEMTVKATIAEGVDTIEFRIYHDVGAGISYVDDLRVTGPVRDKLYIGDSGLALNKPHQILYSADTSIYREPWLLLRDYHVGSDGYLYLPSGVSDYRLRILGIGYLDFLVSGSASETWAATIAIDKPQLDILVAEAIVYLYMQMVIPNYTSGDNAQYAQALAYWQAELEARKRKYGMLPPPATIHWG